VKYEIDDFETEVIERSYEIPVLVDFWADWCGPCRVLGPVLEKLASENKDRWAFAQLDTDKHPQLSANYGIQSIPNVKLFVDGEVKDEFIGALPEDMIMSWLSKALPSKYLEGLKEASDLISEKRISEAQKLLDEILETEPTNELAISLLAKIYIFSHPNKAIQLLNQSKESSEYIEIADAIRTFAELFQNLEDSKSLPGSTVKDQYLIAIKDLRLQKFEDALKGFINVMKKDRYYGDDGSRKACIAIFKFLGEDHEITKKYRPAFSSALYV